MGTLFVVVTIASIVGLALMLYGIVAVHRYQTRTPEQSTTIRKAKFRFIVE